MASIGGLSSSTSNSLSSIRGYGGLASGLDRDTLIENMTYGTTSKIQAQYQKKQTLQWKQTAIQGISNKLVEFSRKYSSYTSSTNLSAGSFFSRSQITALGANSSKISVSGSSSISESVSITGVKQLASNAKMSSKTAVSDQSLKTGIMDTEHTTAVSNLENGSFTFRYGNKTVGLFLTSGTVDGYTYDYSDADKAVESINKAMEGVGIPGDKKMSDVMEAYKNSDGEVSFRSKGDEATSGNTITLTGGSEEALKALGIQVSESGETITSSGLSISGTQKLTTDMMLHERLSEKSITFNYNGTSKTIKLEKMDATTSLEDIQKDIQKKLNKEFGTGRIEVTIDGTNEKGSLAFRTTVPNQTDSTTGEALTDSSSVLTLSGSDVGVLGKTGALAVDYGTSNRLNTTSTLLESGLKRLPNDASADTVLRLKVNGVNINPEGKLTYNSSIEDIMNAINNADAGVKISYMKNADKFTIEATDAGASGQIKLEGESANLLFGGKDTPTGYTLTEGQDAIVTVKYAGSDEEIDLVRGSNSFNLDGLNITVKDTFGWTPKADGSGFDKVAGTEAVTFDAKVDVDKITTAVSDMIKDYNDMLELINTEVSTKPNRKFTALTDEQKEQLSESEIEKWETEAKKGLLFNNTDLRSLADSLRFIFPTGSTERQQMEACGITVSTDYSDNGKLVFDETKFRAALESDPEGVKELFTKSASETDKTDKGGLMARLTTVTERYASTTGATKGILIEQAGSTYAPTSILNNRIQKELDGIDDYIERLQDKLKTETDRYIQQFTSLETLISQMNSQSSWLSQVGGTM